MRSAVFVLLALSACTAVALQDGDGPRYNAGGSLLLPTDYREWVFVSAGLGMTYGPQANTSTPEHPSFENVFVNRASHQAFVQTGQWPDKTTFILEIRSSDSKGSINKGGHYQADIAAIESEVKEGGKWTFYAFGHNGTEGKALPRTESCYTCHATNAAVDNTFVQFYPTLLPIARQKGTISPKFTAAEASK